MKKEHPNTGKKHALKSPGGRSASINGRCTQEVRDYLDASAGSMSDEIERLVIAEIKRKEGGSHE